MRLEEVIARCHSRNTGRHHIVQATNFIVPIKGSEKFDNIANCVYCLPCPTNKGTSAIRATPMDYWLSRSYCQVQQVVSTTRTGLFDILFSLSVKVRDTFLDVLILVHNVSL